jgi:uncharacterized membrane protein HdeD (DUF308 family)
MVIRGAVALLLGSITFLWPRMALDTLVELFAAYVLIDGLVAMAGAVRSAETGRRSAVLAIEGAAGIATAFAAMSWPATYELSRIYLLAAWAIVTGVLEIAAGVQLRRFVAGELLLALSGVASIALGFTILIIPFSDEIRWIVGVYAFTFGILLLVLGLRLRPSLTRSHATGAQL